MSLEHRLRTRFPTLAFSYNYSLATKSYFKVGGQAEAFYSAKTKQEAMDILTFCQAEAIPFTILGGASNVIIADEGIEGVVLELGFHQVTIINETSEELSLQAEAGIKTSALVARASSKGATGLEGFIGVPGVLGGAIYNNAHYLGFLIGDSVTQVEAFDLQAGEIVYISHENCQFAYEKSIFQSAKHLIIFSAYFALKKADAAAIKIRLHEAIAKREREQPLSLPSCGCVFQNPSNTPALQEQFPQFAAQSFIPAGFLIEQAGLKGTQQGAVQVSDKHAAFFVNLGGATATDAKTLIKRVKAAVAAKFDVMLKEEVFYLP